MFQKSIIYGPLSSKRACTQQGSKLRLDFSLCIFFHLLCMCLPSAGAKFRNGIYVAHHFSNGCFTKNKIHVKESHIKKKKILCKSCLSILCPNEQNSRTSHFFWDQAQIFSPVLLSASSSHWISQAPSTHAWGRIWQVSLTLKSRLSWNGNLPQWDQMPAKTTLSQETQGTTKCTSMNFLCCLYFASICKS